MARALRPRIPAILFASAVGLAACTQPAVPVRPASLYDRLGGSAAILALADQFAANLAADERIDGSLARPDPSAFEARLVERLCAAAGGPCRDDAGDGGVGGTARPLGEAEIAAATDDLVAALDHFNVPARDKAELLERLGPILPVILGA